MSRIVLFLILLLSGDVVFKIDNNIFSGGSKGASGFLIPNSTYNYY